MIKRREERRGEEERTSSLALPATLSYHHRPRGASSHTWRAPRFIPPLPSPLLFLPPPCLQLPRTNGSSGALPPPPSPPAAASASSSLPRQVLTVAALDRGRVTMDGVIDSGVLGLDFLSRGVVVSPETTRPAGMEYHYQQHQQLPLFLDFSHGDGGN